MSNDPFDIIATPDLMHVGGAALRLALRPKEAARALGICERKLWELTKRDEIPYVKLGKAVLYPVDALRDWLAKRAAAGGR